MSSFWAGAFMGASSVLIIWRVLYFRNEVAPTQPSPESRMDRHQWTLLCRVLWHLMYALRLHDSRIGNDTMNDLNTEIDGPEIHESL